MTRLAAAFAKGRPALVCFITAGDGDTAANLDALVAGGADVIELGMPFTDPMADGPAIQAANLRSLGKGTTTRDVLLIADEFRERHPEVPLVLMGYANPMIRRGPEWFAGECARLRRRRGDLRRHPARGGRRARPGAARAGPRPDPPRHPDHRRRAAARRARGLVRVPLLRLGRRDHRQAAGGDGLDRGERRPHQALDRPARRGRLRRAHARAGRRDRPRRRRRGGRLGAGRAGRRARRRRRPSTCARSPSALAAAVHSAAKAAA